MRSHQSVSMFDLRILSEVSHPACLGMQSDTSLRNCTEFILTPFTTEERCVLARDQFLQLQNEHSRLQSLLGPKLHCKKESEVGKGSLCTKSNIIHCCRLPQSEQEEKRENRDEYRSKASNNDSEYEVELRRSEQNQVLLSNLLREKRRLEKHISKINFKMEVENLQLKAEKHIHNRIIFQIRSRRELETTSLKERTELKKKLAETKELVKRVRDQNAFLAAYVIRKSGKLSLFQRFRLWLRNLNCLRSSDSDKQETGVSQNEDEITTLE